MSNPQSFDSHIAGPSLLFLCVANSARSQMAEGLARARFGDRVRVQSAGSRPGKLHPHAVAVLAEVGVDISSQRAKHIDAIDQANVDTVITLCDEEICPVLADAVTHLAWPLVDPVGSTVPAVNQLERFRAVRDELLRRLDHLCVDMNGVARRPDGGLPGDSG